MAYNVSTLPDFTQVNPDQLINKVVLGGKFVKRMTLQTGIKKDAALNYLDTTPVLQDGSDCGFAAQGDAELTQRIIHTAVIKVNMDFCKLKLLGKYAEYKVRIAASADGDKMPFEDEIAENVASKIAEKLEKAIFFGDTNSTDADLKHFDGLVTLAKADTEVVDVAIAGTKSAYEAIKAVYFAIPERVIDRAEIYVSPALFRQFMQDLVEKNLYHYNPGSEELDEFAFPGSGTKVVKVDGLATSGDTGYILAADPAELFYGTDLENASEDFKIWFSDDADLYKLKAIWNSGVQYAFGDRIVLGTISKTV